MAAQGAWPPYFNYDRQVQLLLPSVTRQYVPENHLSQFILDALEGMDTRTAKVHHLGSCTQQYSPKPLMLALLISSYCSELLSSRGIERATYESMTTRVVCGDSLPRS